MNQQTLNEVRNWFDDYVNRYCQGNGRLHPMLQLKFDHSLRVAVDSRKIASALGWPDKDVGTAEAIGILHDVGRFPQFAKFGTFFDPDSVNHGECGYGVAGESKVLASCSPKNREVILNGIRYHNCRVIPTELEPESLRFLKLIRDADKLDIFYVLSDAIRNKRFVEHPELLLNANPKGPANPRLLQEIREQRSGSYKNIDSLIDMNLLQVTWVYGINYSPTFHCIAERRLLEGIRAVMPNDPEIQEVITAAREFVADKLSA